MTLICVNHVYGPVSKNFRYIYVNQPSTQTVLITNIAANPNKALRGLS